MKMNYMGSTWTGYELVSIVQQQRIKVDTLHISNSSGLFVALYEVPDIVGPPSGVGGSFPGGTNTLIASSFLLSAILKTNL